MPESRHEWLYGCTLCGCTGRTNWVVQRTPLGRGKRTRANQRRVPMVRRFEPPLVSVSISGPAQAPVAARLHHPQNRHQFRVQGSPGPKCVLRTSVSRSTRLPANLGSMSDAQCHLGPPSCSNRVPRPLQSDIPTLLEVSYLCDKS